MSERLSELRQEIQLQNGVFPPLSEAERGALRDSIAAHGVIVPVLVDEELNVICGNNRLAITQELGYPCPMLVLRGLDEGEKREIAIAENAARRQLTRQQKRKLVEHELMHDSLRSDRRIAAVCGVHHSTVATVRAELIEQVRAWRDGGLPFADAPPVPADAPEHFEGAQGQLVWSRQAELSEAIPHVAEPAATSVVELLDSPTRVDSSGREQPARKERRVVPLERRVCVVGVPFDVVAGEVVEVWRVAGEFEVRRSS